MHSLVEGVRNFLENSHVYVKDREKLAEVVFTFLICNVTDKGVRDELGKAIMQLQFPDSGEETLLRVWEIATASSVSEKGWNHEPQYGKVISSVLDLVRKARIEAEETARQLEEEKEEREEEKKEKDSLHILLNNKIDFLELSVRTLNALRTAGIEHLGELVEKSETELRKVRGIGCAVLNEIKEELKKYDLPLGMDCDGWELPQNDS